MGKRGKWKQRTPYSIETCLYIYSKNFECRTFLAVLSFIIVSKRVFYLKIVKPTPVSSKQATPAGDTDLPTSKVGLFDLEPKKREWRV